MLLTRILCFFSKLKGICKASTKSLGLYHLHVIVTEKEGKCIVRINPALKSSRSTLHW